jgi:hypothetical protein
MSHFIYRLVSTRTAEGIEQAERYQAEGWRILSVGFDTLQLEKEIE